MEKKKKQKQKNESESDVCMQIVCNQYVKWTVTCQKKAAPLRKPQTFQVIILSIVVHLFNQRSQKQQQQEQKIQQRKHWTEAVTQPILLFIFFLFFSVVVVGSGELTHIALYIQYACKSTGAIYFDVMCMCERACVSFVIVTGIAATTVQQYTHIHTCARGAKESFKQF